MGYDFTNRNSLLDTNILKEMTQKTKRSESFRPVFDFLAKHNVTPFVLDATKFEFVGYSTNKGDFDRFEKLISPFWTSPSTPDDIVLATKVSAMYKCKNPNINPKQISFVDCLHAAQLIRFKERAFVVTSDINDYPSFLFEMVHSIPVEDPDGTTSFVAFKTFNQEKWKELQAHFESSRAR